MHRMSHIKIYLYYDATDVLIKITITQLLLYQQYSHIKVIS